MPKQQAGGHLEFFSQRVFIKLLNNNKCNGRREVMDSLGSPSENGVQKLWETNRGGKLPAERRKKCMQENSKSRMFNYHKFIVLLGC